MNCPKCGRPALKIANMEAHYCRACDAEITPQISPSAPPPKRKANKYGVAAKEERTMDGIVFDSKKEMNRYAELKLLEKAGEIADLRRQEKFPIMVGNPTITVCTYIADFTYFERCKYVVEDSKGMRTPEYKLKKKLVEALYGLKIKET